MSHASVRHLTPYGMAECTWTIQKGSIEVKVVVPPNATASISLPGKEAEPLEVGSGTYCWSYAYRDPDARPPLSIDSTIGEICDDPRAWAVVKNTLTRLLPENAFIVRVVQSQSKTTLRQGLALLPNADEVLTAIADRMAELGRDS